MEWLEAEFAALGLEVYSQNFSARKLITIGSEVRDSLLCLTSLISTQAFCFDAFKLSSVFVLSEFCSQRSEYVWDHESRQSQEHRMHSPSFTISLWY